MSQVIVPSKMALLAAKGKKKSAQKGHDLLKRKADALKVQFMQVTKALIGQKKNLGNEFTDSLILLSRADFSCSSGDIKRVVDENVETRASIKLTLKTKPLAGVTLPQFGLRNLDEEKMDDNTILGLTGGGDIIRRAKKKFKNLLDKIIEIATLQTSYLAIDECLKITNRRVNALEYIVIPRIQYTITYIENELEERAKEEKFKIKKVLKYKEKHKEEEEAQRKEEKQKILLLEGGTNEEKDEDIKEEQGNINDEINDEELSPEDKLF